MKRDLGLLLEPVDLEPPFGLKLDLDQLGQILLVSFFILLGQFLDLDIFPRHFVQVEVLEAGDQFFMFHGQLPSFGMRLS